MIYSVVALLALGGGAALEAAGQYVPSDLDREHREIFRELVEINTSPDGGSVAPAARAVAGRLTAAGFPAADVETIGPSATCVNVVANMMRWKRDGFVPARVGFYLQAAEKQYVTFALTATNEGGHSSVPRPDNAIYALAAALGRLAASQIDAVPPPALRIRGSRL